MTTLLVDNASFVNSPRRYNPPVPGGLEWFSLFGKDERSSRRNLAPDKPNLVANGLSSDRIFDNYVRFKGAAAYVDTSAPETAEFTVFAVMREVVAHENIMIVGTYRSIATLTDGGAAIYIAGGEPKAVAHLNNGGAVVAERADSAADTTIANFQFIWARYLGGVITFGSKTAGYQIDNDTSSAPRIVSGRNWRVGYSYVTGGYTGEADHALSMGYSVGLSNGDVETVYQALRGPLSKRGIIV